MLLLAAGAFALGVAAATPGHRPADNPAASVGVAVAAEIPSKAPCSHPVGHQSHAGCVSAPCSFDSGIAGDDGWLPNLFAAALPAQEAQLLRGVGTALPFHPPRTFTRV